MDATDARKESLATLCCLLIFSIDSPPQGIHSEMRRLRTRMMFFKTYKAANADFSEQRRNEAFAAL